MTPPPSSRAEMPRARKRRRPTLQRIRSPPPRWSCSVAFTLPRALSSINPDATTSSRSPTTRTRTTSRSSFKSTRPAVNGGSPSSMGRR
ncbi:hypothetical protein BCR35DRAFT_308370 [Leucosporidium creatinivorum]|uniref:Uncharacterized protein n=1 Tax=Leucosporidium creatinivorum TaxID=106004 RepID=A0A1Y2E6M4_9BASI|nr:hypothetical protein BCR35DRAFT_308370 [Leucosporidium creatinivorum]